MIKNERIIIYFFINKMKILLNKPRFRTKIVLFDYDWTLVKPKTGGTFPKDIDDWQWLRPNVPDIIKNYYYNGYGIYIVSNQSKEWKVTQIINVLSLLNIPITIGIARNKIDYKPNIYLWNLLIPIDKQNKIKKNYSFMCGDALGRKNDYADVDLKFAENINLTIKSPEEIFPFEKKDINISINKNIQEIIIMVGFPGAGKTTISKNIFEPNNYKIISGDLLKTSSKIIKECIKQIKNNNSIVIDATNSSIKKRAEFIKLAYEFNLKIRCIYVNTSFEEALIRNNKREKPIPLIIYNVYKKNFQEPSISEGFDNIIII